MSISVAPCNHLRQEGVMPALQLFLLAGQSNMSGRGLLPSVPQSDFHQNILMLKEDLTWVPANDPLHFDRPNVGVGPGLSFARRIAVSRPDWRIGLVPTAVGGSPLDDWQPGAPLLVESLKRARHAMKSGVFAGILWHQGERDSRDMEKAVTYATRLEKAIAAFRKDLGDSTLPFIVGGIGAFLADREDPGFPGLETVNRALRALPDRVAHTAFVTADGLNDLGDQIHLDTASQIEFGQRYASAFLELRAGARP